MLIKTFHLSFRVILTFENNKTLVVEMWTQTFHHIIEFYRLFLAVLGNEVRTSCLLDGGSTTELYPGAVVRL